jgi:hypothetical protein
LSEEINSWKNKKPIRFLLMFCMIMGLYFLIEVLPLNFGTKHIPWSEIPAHIQARLPIVVMIALAAAAYIVTVKQRNTSGKK